MLNVDYIHRDKTETVIESAVRTARINLLRMLIHLPEYLDRIEENLKKQKAMEEKFKAAQEGGKL